MTSPAIVEESTGSERVAEAPAAESPDAPPAYEIVHRPSRRHLWVLLGICLLGALLRFSFTDRPQLWGDDAYTVYRTHAEFQAMLDILQYDGFTPLHYELYWLLGRIAGTENSPMTPGGPPIVHSTGLTPRAVRFLPALFGTLMVPGMYFLAVQLVRRRTALVVALFTACSAYLLGYSRDGKMYVMQWCFSAWSVATLLWWFRTNTRVAYLSWVASSLFMASSHMTGMALLPLEAVFFLTRRKVEWRQSILFVIGLAIAILPPAGYIAQFNRWAQEEVEDMGFEVEGLTWVVAYNAGRSGTELVLNAVTAYLFSWESPSERLPGKTPAWVVGLFGGLLALFLVLLFVGAMPWSRRLRGVSNVHRPSSMVEGEPEPWWRVVLWLGVWIVVPTYFLYCRSMPDFSSPGEWWEATLAFLAGPGWRGEDGRIRAAFSWCLVLAVGVVGVGVFLSERFRQAVIWGVLVAAGVGLVVAALRGRGAVAPGGEREWVLSAVGPVLQWAGWLTEPVVVLALVILLPGVVLYACGDEWRGRAKRVAQFAMVVAALVACCWLIYTLAHNKYEKEVAQAVAAEPGSRAARLMGQFPGATKEEQARAYVNYSVWQSIFMPRYMGFVWIAVCVAVCGLLMRLPTAGLRYGAVGLLLAVNLVQFWARLFAGSEPPLQQVAADVWRHDSHNPAADLTTRVYVNDSPVAGPGHPGYGTLAGQQGKYYLGLARGYWIHPSEWKSVPSSKYFDVRGSRGGGRGRGEPLSYPTIAAEVRRSPEVKRVVVWEKFFDGRPPAADPLLPSLGAGWTRAGEPADYRVRFHWSWTDLYLYRRSEYVKQS